MDSTAAVLNGEENGSVDEAKSFNAGNFCTSATATGTNIIGVKVGMIN